MKSLVARLSRWLKAIQAQNARDMEFERRVELWARRYRTGGKLLPTPMEVEDLRTHRLICDLVHRQPRTVKRSPIGQIVHVPNDPRNDGFAAALLIEASGGASPMQETGE